MYAFSRAADAQATEFYFLEMKRKGLPLTITSYNTLLNAYARNQAVGVRPYPYKGRYAKPKPREKSDRELDLATVLLYIMYYYYYYYYYFYYIIIIMYYHYYVLLLLLLFIYKKGWGS